MVKAVLFDLDQTLIDFLGMKKKASKKAADAMIKAGLRLDKRTAGKKLFEFYLKHGIDSDTAFTKFIKKIQGKLDYKILAAGINAYLSAKLIGPYPNVKPVLKKLKRRKIKLGIITDAPALKAWKRLNAMGLDDLFDTVIAFEDTGRKKPHKLPFRLALKKLNLKPEEVLFVGDWPEKDIKGARNAGMKTVFARYGGRKSCLAKCPADYTIDDIKTIITIVDNTRVRNDKL
jgi:HAD superfamily hydrolase (TIGR02253 family)